MRTGRPRRFSFTLIEATVVITVLALLAARVLVNVVALQRSQAAQTLKADILRFPAEALTEAQKSKRPVTLRIEGSDTLVMERREASPEGSEAQAATGERTELKRLTLSSDITIDQVTLEGESADTGTWEWTVYPDGSAPAGRIEFLEGSNVLSLRLSGDGEQPRWTAWDTTEAGEERWSAGELEQRGS